MPYIVTAKRAPTMLDYNIFAETGERPHYSRRAVVATLDERHVFDAPEWESTGYDKPDGNARHFHNALVLSVTDHGDGEQTAEILWLHTGRVSSGHILDATEPALERILPESGGTVGPLPDGTVIEVERVEPGVRVHVGPLLTGCPNCRNTGTIADSSPMPGMIVVQLPEGPGLFSPDELVILDA